VLHENGADEPHDGFLIREDADDVGSALDLLIQSLQQGLSQRTVGIGLPIPPPTATSTVAICNVPSSPGKITASSKRRTGGKSIFIGTPSSTRPSTD
jgi:hypothetical protein